LLPAATLLHLDACEIDDAAAQITLCVRSTQTSAPCPLCATPTRRIHSDYTRTLADLPWAQYRMRLQLRVHKWFCRHRACPRRIFTERLPTITAPWARRTLRLAQRLLALGVALGGTAGVRLGHAWEVAVSRNTLLRLLRRQPELNAPTPRVLGVDDFALRKRQTYGTVLIDLERRQPVALLPDREGATFARWLQAHPGVEVITRDRAKAYAAGVRQGAPEATQVADRFHLLKNLAAALQEVFSAHHREIAHLNHVPHHEPSPQDNDAVPVPTERPVPVTKAQQQIAHNRAKRMTEYAQAHALHQQGWTMKAIATHMGRHHRTVKHYLQASIFPERPPRRRPPSILDPYKASLLEHWQAGCRSVKELYHEIQVQGFPGKYNIVAAYMSRLRPPQGWITGHRKSGSPATIVAVDKPLTPSRATWLVMRREAKLDDDDKSQLARLQAQEGEIAEAITLTQDFAALVRQRQPDQLETWLERAAASGLNAFKSLANGLRADYEAVKAGVTLHWSTGPVEGQINRLKMLKRQMYGRAGIDLLRQRVLHPT
jgi:transposase